MLDLEVSWHGNPERYSEISSLPFHRSFLTPGGPVLLHDSCSFSFVQQLNVDGGLRAFARRPEREYALLLDLARRDDSSLTLAYTPEGIIVGQLTLAPADDWWQDAPNTYEIAFEVSSNWRKQGIARQLIELVRTKKYLEHAILLAMGFSWHWDTQGLGLPSHLYRAMLARLVEPYGFVEYQTSEPNICEDPANILLVRLGQDISQQTLSAFYTCLFRSDTLPGL